MSYKYLKPFGTVNNNSALELLDLAAKRLHDRLIHLDLTAIPVTEYTRTRLLWGIDSRLELYVHLLALSVGEEMQWAENMVIVDYGGGSGLLSLLAKEAGAGKVIYLDVDLKSTIDAEIVGQNLGIPADYYLTGEIDALKVLLNRVRGSCTALVSYDVIEHIYDIEVFLHQLAEIPCDGEIICCFASGANPYNPMITRQLMRRQYRNEFFGRGQENVERDADTRLPYRDIRRGIIKEAVPELQPVFIDTLVTSTRGMNREDILYVVKQYVKTGFLPAEPLHPTNTCDPILGNWEEHLMDFNYLNDLLIRDGFAAEVFSGYYSEHIAPKINNSLARILICTTVSIINFVINKIPHQARKIAPYLILFGTVKGERK